MHLNLSETTSLRSKDILSREVCFIASSRCTVAQKAQRKKKKKKKKKNYNANKENHNETCCDSFYLRCIFIFVCVCVCVLNLLGHRTRCRYCRHRRHCVLVCLLHESFQSHFQPAVCFAYLVRFMSISIIRCQSVP